MAVKTDFYVYVLFRPSGIPCYVGKGRRYRWTEHERLGPRHTNKHLAAIIANAGGSIPKVKIRQGLTDDEACAIEVAFIAAIGREANGGPLINQTDGGDGRGRIQSLEERNRRREALNRPEVKAKMRAAHLGKPSSRKGIKASDETRKKLSIKLSGRVHSDKHVESQRNGQKKRWTDQEQRVRQSKVQLDRYSNPEERRKTGDAISAALSTPEAKIEAHERMIRRFTDPAERKKQSDNNIKRYEDPEERRKTSEAIKRHWIIRRTRKTEEIGITT